MLFIFKFLKLIHYITCYFIGTNSGNHSGKFKHSGVYTVLKIVKFQTRSKNYWAKKLVFYHISWQTRQILISFCPFYTCYVTAGWALPVLTRWTFFHFQVNIYACIFSRLPVHWKTCSFYRKEDSFFFLFLQIYLCNGCRESY